MAEIGDTVFRSDDFDKKFEEAFSEENKVKTMAYVKEQLEKIDSETFNRYLDRQEFKLGDRAFFSDSKNPNVRLMGEILALLWHYMFDTGRSEAYARTLYQAYIKLPNNVAFKLEFGSREELQSKIKELESIVNRPLDDKTLLKFMGSLSDNMTDIFTDCLDKYVNKHKPVEVVKVQNTEKNATGRNLLLKEVREELQRAFQTGYASAVALAKKEPDKGYQQFCEKIGFKIPDVSKYVKTDKNIER